MQIHMPFRVTIMVSSALASMGAAHAQSSPSAPVDADDIIVTAQRSASVLSKTPLAMTVLSSEDIRDAGITDARKLSSVVPNVRITGSGQISIRGVSSTDATEKGDPSAAFMFDGIYLSRREDVQGALYDVGRVEVLRGPQGTLYGRNTTAGVINVISNRPTDVLSASVDASIGSYNTRSATGTLNLPLGEGIGLRAALNYRRQDAYYDIVSGPVKNLSMLDTVSGRLSFGGKTLDDRLTFVVIADASHDTGDIYTADSTVTIDRFFTNTTTPGVNPTYIHRPANEQLQLSLPPSQQYPWSKNFKSWGIMTDTTYDFGPVQLSYLGSYRKSKQTWSAAFLFFGVQDPFLGDQDYHETSHELRLAFGTGKRLHGLVGAYYFNESLTLEASRLNPFANFFASGATAAVFLRNPADATSKAAFGNLTFDITNTFRLTGGVRYTKDEKNRLGQGFGEYPNAAAIPPGTPNCVDVRCLRQSDIQHAKFSQTTWKVGAEYDSPLGLIYGTVSTGYKAGGFNDGCVQGSGGIGCIYPPQFANLLYYNPEKLTSYEVGAKFRFGRTRVNASAFHYDYSDLQVTQIIVDPLPGSRTTNAAKAKVDGIELSTTTQLTDNDRLEANLNWLHARYTDFAPDATRPTFNFNGKRLDNAPDFTASVAYTHIFQLSNGGRIEMGGRVSWTSDYYLINIGNRYQFRQPSFTKTDVNVTYNAPHDRFYVQAFGRNLENNITIGGAGTTAANIQEPRIYGVNLGVKF